MKATIVWIHTNKLGEYLVPPIVPGADFHKTTEVLDALHYAQWQADIYNRKTGRVKFPSLAGECYIPRAKIELGAKARERLGIDLDGRRNHMGRNVFESPIHNIMYLKMTPLSLYGILFGTVFCNGEWASICSQEVRPTATRSELLWSNLRVMKMKEQLRFPENPYMKDNRPPTPDPGISNLFSDRSDVAQAAIRKLTESIKLAGSSFLEANDSIRTISGRVTPPSNFLANSRGETLRDPLEDRNINNMQYHIVPPEWFTTPNTLVEIDVDGNPVPPPPSYRNWNEFVDPDDGGGDDE